MKAQVITRFGDNSIFESMDLPRPAILPGHALIRVMATSVNPLDYKLRSGVFPSITAEFPAILHGDVAGVIEEIGAGVTEFKVDDEIYGCAGGLIGQGGALAEFMLVDVKLIALKPHTLSMAEAAAIPLVALTAWEGLFDKIKIVKGQKMLVHAGTGGVGHMVIQLAKWAGADVYATVSSLEKAAIATSLGAIEAINYHEESVDEYVNRLTDGKGFDVVFDTVGGKNIDTSFLAVAHYGHVISILSQSVHDLSLLQGKSASLHVVFMLLPLLYNNQREHHGDILKRIATLVDEKSIKPLIDARTFSFEQVGEAHALLESGKALGKVVICRE